MRVLKFIRDIELGDRALSSAFIEDSSHPGRGQDATHQTRYARSHRECNEKNCQSYANRRRDAVSLTSVKNLYFAKFYAALNGFYLCLAY